LPDSVQEDCALVFEALHREPDPSIRLAAAISTAKIARGDIPPSALDMLLDGLVHPEQYNAHESEVIGMLSHRSILAVIKGMGPSGGMPMLLEALGQVQDPEIAHEVAATALMMAFETPDLSLYGRAYSLRGDRPEIQYWGGPKEGQKTAPDEAISDEQAAILNAILCSAPFWVTKTNLLSLFGLPDAKKALRTFLQRHP